MKILCVIDSLNSGGAQRQMVELAKGFKEKGHEVSFLTYHNINFFKPQLDKAEIPVKTIVEPNYVKRLFKMRRAIRQENPEAVLAFLIASSFIATFAGFPNRSWRLIVGERSANPKAPYSLKTRSYKLFHFFADGIVGNSKESLRILQKTNPFLNKKKQKVIYNALAVSDVDLETYESENGITELVIAARYVKLKNLMGLIEAVNLLPENYKNQIKVNWYGQKKGGDIDYLRNAQSKIEEYNLKDSIVLNDATAEIFKKYQKADFVALLSHHESFPNTVCEAMALKKPVIVSKVSDVPIFIKEYENGFICDSKDVDSIKNSIIKAIDSTALQRRKTGVNNYKLAMNTFDKERIVEKYLKLLQYE